MSLKVPSTTLRSRTPSPTLRRPHSRSNPKTLGEAGARARGRKRSNTVDFGFLCPDFTSIKIAQIQKKFPTDALHLNESLDAQYFLLGRALSSQRRSAPQIVISKLQEKWIKSSTNLSAETTPSRSSKTPTADDLSPNVCRNFIHEGAVHLSTGVSSLTRYMFLFSDLLLIAKPKSTSSYKLKTRLPVCELWIQENIEGVTEENVLADRSFVIGWPTVSYVATFSSADEKSLWWNVLKKTIDEQRTFECGKTVPIRIVNRDEDQKNTTPLSLPVSNEDDVKSVVRMALNGFDIQNADANDYQLWVVSGKENAAYPLMGHEIPFCIRMNHVRQSNVNASNLASTQMLESEFNFEPVSPKSKCEFILKKKKAVRPRLELESPNSQKRWRSPMKSPIINWALHKKPTKQSPLEPAPLGSLFGLPLSQVAVENEQLPTPIQEMLVELFRRGPSTVGIFRKSPLMRSVKQLRQDLDEGKTVSLDDKSSVVIATVLKEFLRVLPSCAFGSEFPNELQVIKDISDPSEKAKEISRHLDKLPKINQLLVKKFFCALYHISRYSNTNNMTPQNLAICIAPSLVWTSKALKASSPLETVSSCEVVEFIIDHFAEVFGEDAMEILGSESDIQPPMTYDDEEPSENQEPDSPKNQCEIEENTKANFRLLVPDNLTNSFNSQGTPNAGSRTVSPKLRNGDTSKSVGNMVFGLNRQNRRHSENDLTDMNDNLEHRKTKKRFPLESFTTTTELIKHHVNGHANTKGEDTSPSIIRIISAGDDNPTSPTHPRRKNSPSNHTLYHQKGRPAPPYEEAVKTLRHNDRRGTSPLLSSINSDDKSNSSEESIPGKLIEDYSTSGSRSKRETDAGSKTGRHFVQRNGAHTTYVEPFQTNRYTADELRRRSPVEVFSSSGRWRQPAAPSYQEHLQRRKRFERAYLQQINLEKKDEQFDANRNLRSQLDESLNDRVEFTRSFNASDVKKPTSGSNESLSSSLDSSGFRRLRNRSNSDGRAGVPLSNGVHTFLTQKRSQQRTDANQDASKSPKNSSRSRGHETVTFTHSVHPLSGVTENGDNESLDNKAISPLRAALNAGSFMYCSDGTKEDVFSKTVSSKGKPSSESAQNNMKLNSQNVWNCDYPSSKQKQDLTKAAEDFDRILSKLRNYDAGSDSSSGHSSVSDSACEFDIPSHEDIKNILCQDESYV